MSITIKVIKYNLLIVLVLIKSYIKYIYDVISPHIGMHHNLTRILQILIFK